MVSVPVITLRGNLRKSQVDQLDTEHRKPILLVCDQHGACDPNHRKYCFECRYCVMLYVFIRYNVFNVNSIDEVIQKCAVNEENKCSFP